MAKKYWEGEYNINTDWGGDESTNNLPLPGSAVQDVIKTELKSKVGYIAEKTEEAKVYFSSSREEFEKGNYIGSVDSTPVYALSSKFDENNKTVFLSSDTNKNLVWYFRTWSKATEAVEQEDVVVEYTIFNKNEAVEKKFSTTINANSDSKNDYFTKVTLNLDEYLTNGESRITINTKGFRTKQVSEIGIDIAIISLEIEDKTEFWLLNDDILNISVDVNCTIGQYFNLQYRLDDNSEFILHNEAIRGSGKKTNHGYAININDLSEGKHVLEYRIFVKLDTSIEPYYTNIQRVEFIKSSGNIIFNEPQILIFSSYGINESPKADDGNIIINGVSQYIPYTLKYAIYNSNGNSVNVEFHEIVDGQETSVPITDTIANSTYGEYNVQAVNSGIKKINIITKNIEDSTVMGPGRIVYLNVVPSELLINVYDNDLRIDFSSVGKNNNSADKNTWKSIVKGGLYTNSATFSEAFDWSQGWTDNGLVISEGSEITFDYAPFPKQESNASSTQSKEYVGGDKAYTFEIEFMTQNVTNEDAIVCDMVDEGASNCGLQITGSQIKFTTPGNNTVSTRFKAEEMNRVTIIVRPQWTEGNEPEFRGLVELYVNGELSNIAKYDYNDKFVVESKNAAGVRVSKNLSFKGVEGADIIVKYIRAYNGAMNPDDVVNNYILFRTNSKKMLELYNKNNVMNEQEVVTPESIIKLGNIPVLIFFGRTKDEELAPGENGQTNAADANYYVTLENTTNKKDSVEMDVVYYNPIDKTKNFKFVKAYVTPQGTSSMYYPKKNYRIYTQKTDTRMFLSTGPGGVLEYNDMKDSKFGEREGDSVFEFFRGEKKKKLYSFKDNAQPVKCWCLKADFAETSSSHNTGIARLWGETLKNASVKINNQPQKVFRTNAQTVMEDKYIKLGKINEMPDIRTTIDGFPIVVFGAKSYSDEIVFLGQYNFNNDKSTESVFGFCDIDDDIDNNPIIDQAWDYDKNEKVEDVKHTLDNMLDKYMSCVETLDNGNVLANFSNLDDWEKTFVDEDGEEYKGWENAFEFRYPEIPEKPSQDDYQNVDEYNEAVLEYEADLKVWKNSHLKPLKHFAQWLYDVKWCDVNGDILPGLSEEEAMRRKEKFAIEKWEHLDVWKMAAYYIYAMRFGAVDQIVKNSMLTSEGPFACNIEGIKYGYWDSTNIDSPNYGQYFKWYYINYDNDTIMGVKNNGSLAFGPDITRKKIEADGTHSYAGWDSTLWNNFDTDEEFQKIVRMADQGISDTMSYNVAINMFDIEQVGKWCERIYNKDAEYKYINPYIGEWTYKGKDENADNFQDKLFMLQGSRTAHRHWWLSKRFNLFDGKWASGDFATKFVEVKCNYAEIGDKFSAIAGSDAYFGYQINNQTFGSPEGGETMEYKANETINWELKKVVNIGDPIAIFGSTDMLELNLMGLSKTLANLTFNFGKNNDIKNKLERLVLSIPDDLLFVDASYKDYADIDTFTKEYNISLDDFNNGKYITSTVQFEASDVNSPDYYRLEMTNEEGDITYIYFAKIKGGVRNYSCNNNSFSFKPLDKLQELEMRGYSSIETLDLTSNKFINKVDVRYCDKLSSVNFAEGARVKEFYAPASLAKLAFNSCNNIKLSNIIIDSVSLKENGGVNINNIEIFNSAGLNQDNTFKDFILNWIKTGDIGNKTLLLKGIRWTGLTIKDIEALLTFASEYGGLLHGTCELSGVIEMANKNLSQANINLINELKNLKGMDLIVKIPTNILLNAPESVVASESKVYEIGCTLYPDEQSIIDAGGIIQYYFVEESDERTDLDDKHNSGKYYRRLDNEQIRNSNVELINRPLGFNTTLKVNETVEGEDTQVLIAAILDIAGLLKFDVRPLIIKDPTYAVSGILSGPISLTEKGKTFDYKLSLTSNKNQEPIGTINIDWNIDFEPSDNNAFENGLDFISSSAISEDRKTLSITLDDNISPEMVANFVIKVNVENYVNSGYKDVDIRKEVSILNENIIMTNVTNPTAMRICHDNGLSVMAEYMTKAEAQAVSGISTYFSNINENWTFDELIHFTNENFNKLDTNAFKNSNITSITLPDNIKTLGEGVFEGCKYLQTIILPKDITSIPKKTFLGCSSLIDVYIPNKVASIEKNAFGGVGIEVIGFTDKKENTHKVIYIEQNCGLRTILNDAFEDVRNVRISNNKTIEVSTWINSASTISTTNVLRKVSLPANLNLQSMSYNFLLSPYLEDVVLVDDLTATSIFLEDNVLYVTAEKSALVRALPLKNGDVKKSLNLPDTEVVFDYAFYNCNSVKDILLGNLSTFGLGEGAFYNSKIESVDLSNSIYLRELMAYTFYNCNKLKTVNLPLEDGELAILGERLFYNSPDLKELVLPDTVMVCKYDKYTSNKSSYTINNCGIEYFKFPENLNVVPLYFMESCENLKTIEFSKHFTFESEPIKMLVNKKEESVGNAKYNIISNCSSITDLKLPIFSTSIKEKCYYIIRNKDLYYGPFTTSSLAENKVDYFKKDIDNSVNIITTYEVKEYNVGDTLVVNKDVFLRGRYDAFQGCDAIDNYVLHEDDENKIIIAHNVNDKNVALYKVGEAIISKNYGTINPLEGKILSRVSNTLSDYEALEGTTIISGAFSRNKNITSYTIPNGVVRIENGAFYQCENLADVEWSNTLKVITEFSFLGCSALKELILPYSVEEINDNAFSACTSLENIVFNENLKKLENTAFGSCKSLKEIEIPETLTVLDNSVFTYCDLRKVTIPSTFTYIGKSLFSYNYNLSEVEILSDKLEYIDQFAFAGCRNLKTILLRTAKAPQLMTGFEYSGDIQYPGIFDYHPFGYDRYTVVAMSVPNTTEKTLYLPFKHEGYDNEKWMKPLLTEGYSGFKIQNIELNGVVKIKGIALNNESIIYLKSERDEFNNNGEVETSTPINGICTIIFNGEVYDNETIYIYKDSACTEILGSFVAKYGQEEYNLDEEIVLGATKARNISNNMFSSEEVVDDNEVVQITKKEYEILQSKINQLMKLLNKK